MVACRRYGSLTLVSALIWGCSDGAEPGTPVFDEFAFKGVNAEVTLDDKAHTVKAVARYGVDAGHMVAVFEVPDNVSVTVNDVAQESGTTANDFRQPVEYVLDGNTKAVWTVTVEVPSAADAGQHNAMLSSLGLQTDLGSRKDPKGESVAADYNPFSRKVTTLFKQTELYSTGMTFKGRREFMLDDKEAQYGQLLGMEGDTAWTDNYITSAAGDLDADGFEEVVVVVLNRTTWDLEVRIIEDESDGFRAETQLIMNIGDPGGYFGPMTSRHFGIDVATGDVDGDGKDEILITCVDDLYVLDGPDANLAVIDSKQITGTVDERYLRVATGDLDADGIDEFVVTAGEFNPNGVAEYYIFDSSTRAPLDDGVIGAQVEGTYHKLMTADVQIADFDGDGLPEIGFAGVTPDRGMQGIALIMDDAKQPSPFEFMGVVGLDNNEGGAKMLATAAADMDGDREAEFIVGEDIYTLENGELTTPFGNEALPIPYMDVLVTGDMTGDHRADIILLKESPTDGIFIYGLDSSHQFRRLDHLADVERGGYMTLCPVNVDGDSAAVEFLGNELLFTDPNIIAVLSSPPYHTGIDQNTDDSGTTFGKSEGQEVTKEQSIGFSVGYSFGAEFEAPFGLASASFKATVDQSFNWTASESKEIETSIAYRSGPGEDKVVFTAIPFDVYYYKVLSSPEPEQVGTTISINIPRKPQTLSVDRELYNSNNGNEADITEEAIGHVIGDVWSYPRKAAKDALIKDGGLQSKLATVGAGSGSVILGISTTEGKGSGSSFDMSVGFEAEVGVGGITAGMSASFDYGYAVEVTNTESTFFEGEVGDIPSAKYSADLLYQFGLFTYSKSFRGQRFAMVEYWVE